MNYLLNYIRTHKNWKDLLQAPPFCLEIKTDEDYPLLFLFKYTNVSDLSLPLVQEARGVILEVPECRKMAKYVSRPFKKFFNFGEANAAELDPDPQYWFISEKMDGSMVQVYSYNNKLMIGTTGTINAFKTKVNGLSISFGQLFMCYFDKYIEKFPSIFDTECTYLFELVSLENRVVIDYDVEQRGLYLLDVLYNEYGEHAGPAYRAASNIFKKPQIYNFNSLDEIIDFVKTMGKLHEGVVVVDRFGERLKIKSPEYFELHKAYNNGHVSEKRVLEMIQKDTVDDFIGMFPRYTNFVDKIQRRFYQVANYMWYEVREMVGYFHLSRKEMEVIMKEKNIRFKDLVWRVRDEKTTVYQYLFDMPLSRLVKIVNEINGDLNED